MGFYVSETIILVNVFEGKRVFVKHSFSLNLFLSSCPNGVGGVKEGVRKW